MRRKEREMDAVFAWRVFDGAYYATLSMIDGDGMPYCVPISPVRDGEKIYFHCAYEGKKMEALGKNPACQLTSVSFARNYDAKLTCEYECAMFFGAAGIVEDEEEKMHALHLISARYAPTFGGDLDKALRGSFARTAILRIDVTDLSGKRLRYGSDGKELTLGKEN